MAMKTEGPFLKGRKWYSQFYAARDDIQATQETVNGIYHVPGVQTPADRDHAIDDGPTYLTRFAFTCADVIAIIQTDEVALACKHV